MSGIEPIHLASGDISLWIDRGAIMMRVNEPHGHSIELANHEAKQLADKLLELIELSPDAEGRAS